MKPKKDLIHCQMIVGNGNDPFLPNSDFSNMHSIFVDEDTLQVYDEDKNLIGIAKREFGSEILTIKLN